MGRVLVTGGAGFIGSFATQALLRAGHETVVYDDLSQGHREAVERLAAAAPGQGHADRGRHPRHRQGARRADATIASRP